MLKNKINNKIIKEILGENIYFTINQKLKEINQYEKLGREMIHSNPLALISPNSVSNWNLISSHSSAYMYLFP